MDIFNPFTALTLIPVAFIVLYIFKTMIKSGSMNVTVGKLFSVSHEADIKHKIDELLIRVENLDKENESVKKDNRSIRRALDYINLKIELRQEYKIKLYKLSKKFNNTMIEYLESTIKAKLHFTKVNVIRSLDEYNIYTLITKSLSNSFILKGVNDFDNNGFDIIATDTFGNFDQRQVKDYAKRKPDEFLQEIFVAISELMQVRPLTLVFDENGCFDFDSFNDSSINIENNIIDRVVIIPVDEFLEISKSALMSMEEDIVDLYDFTITKYNNVVTIYKENLK